MRVWPFRPSAVKQDAERLLQAVTQASRRPVFFGENKAPDTLEGRFEIMALHAALALLRLRADPAGAELAQKFTDRLFRHFDAGLREAGVGDLTVPKRMRKLASDFYGRLEAYDQALASQAALEAALARNLVPQAPAFAASLARYVANLAERQAEAPASGLLTADAWRGVPD